MQGRRGSAAWARGLRWLAACWVLAWAWAPASAAAAQDRVLARAYWPEPCVEYSVDRLPQQDFRPFEGVLAQGYGRCAVWVRLLLAAADGPSVLRIRPPYLDEITLYDPLLPTPLVAGDRHPRAAGADSRVILFTVPGSAAPRQLWLRISSSNTRMMAVQAYAPQEAAAQDRSEDRLQVAFLLLLALPWLWAALQWWYLRDRLLGVFAVKQAVVVAWALLVLGYGPGLLGGLLAPTTIDRLTSALALVVTAVSIWCDRVLMAGYAVPRWGPRLLLVLIGLLPLKLALLFGGQPAFALALNAVVGWVAMLLVVALYLLARPRASDPVQLPARLLAAFYALILALVSMAFGTHLGLLPGGPLALSAVYAHGLLTGVVMVVLLHARARLQARAMGELAAAHALAAQERIHREEQERLVGMLVHEIRTPLAAVRMLLGDGRPSPRQFDTVQRSLADMNGLLERCAQASQLDGDALQPQWTRCDLWQALQDISGNWRDAQRLALHPPLAQPAHVQTDPYWLHIILGNLIDNACKYSPAGSRVQLTLQPADGLVDGRACAGFAVAVANLPGAAGWPDAQQLFAKYYRSPFARRSTGSGLGLYLVAGLAQRLNGQIRYEPTPEHVRFCLWLPS